MSVVALFTWMVTILAGLILLIIWIIEYDSEFQTAAATRLPVPVISAHALLGLGGLMLWIAYLLLNQKRLAWATVAALGTVAVLGLIMAARWIGVYRTVGNPGPSLTRDAIVPPGTELPADRRPPARHSGRHHPRPGAVLRDRHCPQVTSHR